MEPSSQLRVLLPPFNVSTTHTHQRPHTSSALTPVRAWRSYGLQNAAEVAVTGAMEHGGAARLRVAELERRLEQERALNATFTAQHRQTAQEYAELKMTCDWLMAQLDARVAAEQMQAAA